MQHKKARSFTFIYDNDNLTLSIVKDDGVHEFIDISPMQGCLAFDQLADFAVRQARKGCSEDVLPPCDVS